MTSIAKDVISVLRDGALFILATLLVAFPARFNTILVDAGFEEGSLVGFKWKSKLIESDQALKDAQQTIESLQGKNDELLKALSDANSKTNDPKLLEHISKLEEENKALKTTTLNVQAKVINSIESNAPLVEKALSAAGRESQTPSKKADFLVGLQTVGIEDSERLVLNEALHNEGYSLDDVTWSYPANQRPSWFATQSTVFYYSANSRTEATQVAKFLRAKTGQDFVVQRGSGLGLDPSHKETTFFVHYLRGK